MAAPGKSGIDGASAGSTRLAYLVSQYPAVNHAFMFREIRELRRRGFHIEVASISSPDRPLEKLTAEEKEEAATTFFVKAQPLSAVLRSQLSTLVARPLKYLSGLVSALRVGGGWKGLLYFAEAVVVGDWMSRRSLPHGHVHYSSTVGLIASRIFPVTISATMHGPDEFSNPEGFHLAEKIAVCKFVCAISDFGRSQLMRYSAHDEWEKLHVVRLGVDTNLLRPQPTHGTSPVFRLLTAGRLAPVKGQHILLDAIAGLVQRERKNIELHIAGDGPDRKGLEEHASKLGIQDKVVFEGFVNQDQLRELYQKSDVFVLPSFAEGLPVVLMEAMALGVPCVSTWVNGVPELIRDGIDGYTVAPGDSAALADAIELLMSDEERRESLARAGRQRAEEVVDLSKNVGQLAALFENYLTAKVRDNRVLASTIASH